MSAENPEQKKVLHLYSVFGASLVLTLIPSVLAAFVAMWFMIVVLIAAYMIRSKSEEGSLSENHTTFIIRTFWIGGLLVAVTMSAACAYMLVHIDNAPLQPCVLQNEDLIKAILDIIRSPCMDDFIQVNLRVLMISMAIAAGPVMLYFIVRFSRGLSRALSGYRIASPKNWF